MTVNIPTIFSAYCLGTGMEKCRTCQHDQDWKTLNQMPDALRKVTQAGMKRIDESYCQISSGMLYILLPKMQEEPK